MSEEIYDPLKGNGADPFTKIDMATWSRAEFFRLYTEVWSTQTYSLTKKLSVRVLVPYLKERKIKIVPSLIWLVSRAVNSIENFRLAIYDGTLGTWDRIHPLFPTLNAEKNLTFHSLRYGEEFGVFYRAYLAEQEKNIRKTCLWATEVPANFFMVSVLPFLHFEGSTVQLKNAKGYYAPFVAIGQYNEELQLPCTVTGNHAGQDAWHVAQLFDRLQEGMDHPSAWCK